jgi:hypothetical protein
MLNKRSLPKMMNINYITVIIFILLAVIFGCESPQDLNRPGDKLDGYVTHFDTALVFNGGYYSISVFSADSTEPFYRIPLRTDSLAITRRPGGFVYETRYSMDGIPPGRYYIAATWSRYPNVPNEVPAVLGIYDCDTSATCTSYKVVLYPNYEGNFRNIISWSNPAKRMN